jgi:hypothetical protein
MEKMKSQPARSWLNLRLLYHAELPLHRIHQNILAESDVIWSPFPHLKQPGFSSDFDS